MLSGLAGGVTEVVLSAHPEVLLVTGMRLLGKGALTSASPETGSRLPVSSAAGEVVISMRPVGVFANVRLARLRHWRPIYGAR